MTLINLTACQILFVTTLCMLALPHSYDKIVYFDSVMYDLRLNSVP